MSQITNSDTAAEAGRAAPICSESLKPLFIPLKREYFESFEQRKKSVEYRVHGPRWNKNTCQVGRRVTLSLGYGKQRRIGGVIVSFWQSSAFVENHDFVSCYGRRPNATAACIAIRVDSQNAKV